MKDGQIEVVGGARFPGAFGGLVASWPLAKTTVSDAGITVAIRGIMGWSPLSYSFAWSELRSVDSYRAWIVLHSHFGGDVAFGNMFAPAKLGAIVDEVRRHGIPIHG